MSLTVNIRRGKGPFWGTLKWLARKVLHFHVPVWGPTRPLFRLLYALHVGLREGVPWVLRVFWFEPLFRSQCEAVGDGFQMEKLPYISGRGRIVIGNRVRLSGRVDFSFGNQLHDRPELRVGDHTFIGHGCSLNVAESLRIGSHCLLAGGVRISDYDGHPVDAERRRALEPTPPEGIRPVVIGDDVWVGTGVLILKGVTIGDRSVVGAGAVVTRDVPPDVIVAGNPARVVRHLAPPPGPRCPAPCPTPLAAVAGDAK